MRRSTRSGKPNCAPARTSSPNTTLRTGRDRYAVRSDRVNRRELLRGSLVLPLAGVWPGLASAKPLSRVRPGDAACPETPVGADCRTLFKELKNPYFIGDEVGLTQTTGWIDAWNLQESAYAVAAETTSDIVAVVDFARSHNLRLVVKGGGHSYLGTSNAPDSLLIWTRRMYDIEVHEDFVAHGSDLSL